MQTIGKIVFLELFQKLLLEISGVKATKLKMVVYMSFCLDPEHCSFGLTVFDADSNNKTISFYIFHRIDEIEEKIKRIIGVLKKDDFSEVEKFC